MFLGFTAANLQNLGKTGDLCLFKCLTCVSEYKEKYKVGRRNYSWDQCVCFPAN